MDGARKEATAATTSLMRLRLKTIRRAPTKKSRNTRLRHQAEATATRVGHGQHQGYRVFTDFVEPEAVRLYQ